jgi:hypothetical protein
LKLAFDREGISIPYPHRMLIQEPPPVREALARDQLARDRDEPNPR